MSPTIQVPTLLSAFGCVALPAKMATGPSVAPTGHDRRLAMRNIGVTNDKNRHLHSGLYA
jgi:hypothetical protein